MSVSVEKGEICREVLRNVKKSEDHRQSEDSRGKLGHNDRWEGKNSRAQDEETQRSVAVGEGWV